ncbi:MAG: hypothetical protein RMM98_04050 [Acidobacteriota bacterium]|nr:hypothetical protein [Acidobacteriota bacterium]
MIGRRSDAFAQISDPRAERLVDYVWHETLMSGFALRFFQHPIAVSAGDEAGAGAV